MTEQLLPWLNGQINLRAAYAFTRNQILTCLQDIVTNPNTFGVPPENVPTLARVHQDICRLRCPNGTNYLVPLPRQNIDRQGSPNWPRALSPLQLVRSVHDGTEYWALTDLLGLFMSNLGLAPMGATKRNFYLPLTAVFGRWCRLLIVSNRGYWPAVFQCTWNESREYCLGASRGGFNPIVPGWPATLDRARFGIIRSPRLTLASWSQAWTPNIRQNRRHGTPFGRCAETYPFRRLLVSCNESEAQRVHGLALRNRYLLHAPIYDDRLSGRIWTRLWDPCINCRELIIIHEGNVANFARLAGSQGAPP